MSPAHDVKRALGSVVGPDGAPADPADDLARARAAAGARFRRRFRLGLSAVAVAAVLGVASVTVLDDSSRDTPTVAPAPPAESGVRLVSERFDATPFTFDLTPDGWSVQGQRPSTVTIAPDDGSTSEEPDDFRGKLVIMFDSNAPDGRALLYDDREFWVGDGDGYTTVATRTVAGEPAGVVRIQYPADTGWDVDAMVEFLGSVHVGPMAQHGFG